MDRRQFFTSGTAAALAAGMASGSTIATRVARADSPAKAAPSLMKLGTFVADVTDASMKAVVRWGIRNIYASAPIPNSDLSQRLYPTVEELKGMMDIADRNGVAIDILRPKGYLAMENIDAQKRPAIMLGESPQRDRDIEAFQTTIKNCAAVGIPAIRYTLSIVGNSRTGHIPGRGDSSYISSSMADFRQGLGHGLGQAHYVSLTKAGPVSAEMYWERITYFLDHVVPVANEYKVRILCHPEDAMVPPGYEGLYPVTNTVEGAKKFISIQESPYHGFLFCLGTFSEMLQKPAQQIYDVIRYFGSRKKIFMIDFRNIRGNREEFVETFPDEGSIDMVRAMLTLKEVGFDGMVCPDHEPQNPGGPEQTDAFQYGYIRGLLQAVDHMT
jgi:mannonate dehydratase